MNKVLGKLSRMFSYFGRNKKKMSDSFEIKRILSSEYENALEFCCEYYFKEDPLFMVSGLSHYRSNCFFEKQLLKCMTQGSSFMAVCKKSKRLAGIVINTTQYPWDLDVLKQNANCCSCLSTKRLLNILATIYAGPDLFNKYKVGRFFETNLMAVRTKYWYQGLGTQLIKHSRECCAELEHCLYRYNCTTKCAVNICKQLGMNLVYNYPYNRYLTPIPPVHACVRTFIDFPRNPKFHPTNY